MGVRPGTCHKRRALNLASGEIVQLHRLVVGAGDDAPVVELQARHAVRVAVQRQ